MSPFRDCCLGRGGGGAKAVHNARFAICVGVCGRSSSTRCPMAGCSLLRVFGMRCGVRLTSHVCYRPLLFAVAANGRCCPRWWWSVIIFRRYVFWLLPPGVMCSLSSFVCCCVLLVFTCALVLVSLFVIMRPVPLWPLFRIVCVGSCGCVIPYSCGSLIVVVSVGLCNYVPFCVAVCCSRLFGVALCYRCCYLLPGCTR